MYSLTFHVRRYDVMCTDCKSAKQCTTRVRTLPFRRNRVRAVAWECGERQTDTETDTQIDRHTDAHDQYTFRVVYDSREM